MIKILGIDIEATSMAGIRTCIQLPSLKLAFDMGFCPSDVTKCHTVALTHSHIDHIGGMASYAGIRNLKGMYPPNYIVPPQTFTNLQNLFIAYQNLGNGIRPNLVPLAPNDEYWLHNNLVMRCFPTMHQPGSQGYSIWRIKRKLKPMYENVDSVTIAKLVKEEGITPTYKVGTPEIVYTGDTRIDVLKEEVVCKARLLIIEATFVDDKISIEKARKLGHIHLDEIVQNANKFRNKAILLTHFSSRYTRSQILRALDTKLPDTIKERITPLLTGFN